MIKYIIIGLAIVCCSISLAKNDVIWQCRRCSQQYVGEYPPSFTKCPATNNKQTHWWSRSN